MDEQVWPSFWTLGAKWPYGGEIDIIEGINLVSQNQMALHTNSGCIVAPNAPSRQTGLVLQTNCSASSDGLTPNVGCTVDENKPNNYGQGFANAQGGVWAVQMDVAGIFIWFWSVGIFSFYLIDGTLMLILFLYAATRHSSIYKIRHVYI